MSGVQRGPQQVAALGVRLERRLGLVAADHAVVPLLTNDQSQPIFLVSCCGQKSARRAYTLIAYTCCEQMSNEGT